jgi:hypothetical protein
MFRFSLPRTVREVAIRMGCAIATVTEATVRVLDALWVNYLVRQEFTEQFTEKDVADPRSISTANTPFQGLLVWSRWHACW